MAQLTDQSDFLKTALRLPRELHSKIQEAAEANGRSMNAEIVARLSASFEADNDRPAIAQQDVAELSDRMGRLLDAFEELMASTPPTKNTE